jgi:hypothetical protein
MGDQVTVCAKIPVELKMKLIDYDVNISKIIRQALQAEVERLEKEKLMKLIGEASKILQKIPNEDFIKSIREDRDSR